MDLLHECSNSSIEEIDYEDSQNYNTEIIHFKFSGDLEVIRGNRLNHGNPNHRIFQAMGRLDGRLYIIHEYRLDAKENVLKIELQFKQLLNAKHQNLVHYLNMRHQINGDVCVLQILQEFVNGISFSEMYKNMSPRNRFLRDIAEELLDVLDYLHKNKIIHGSLSENCVFYDNHGDVKVSNYSLNAKLNDVQCSEQDDIRMMGMFLMSVYEGRKCSKPPETVKTEIAHLNNFLEACFNPKTKSCRALMRHELFKTTTKLGSSRLQSDFHCMEKIGSGAYGKVIKAKNISDNLEYAIKKIKVTSRDYETNADIIKEVHCISKLTHKYVVRYYSSWTEYTSEESDEESPFEGDDDDSEEDDSNDKDLAEYSRRQYLYIQMEFCEKKTLSEAIQDGLESDPRTMWRFFKEIAMGLSFIHSKRLIHRDMKPNNVLICKNNKIKIGDFGLAKSLYMNKSRPGNTGKTLDINKFSSCVGTPPYSAPEMSSGIYDFKVDIYSLGVIFLEMNYNCTKTELYEVLNNINHSQTFPEAMTSNLEKEFIINMLSKDTSNRPTSEKLVPDILDVIKGMKQQFKGRRQQKK
ncbi:PREDICTED: eIF-2-alpha kinase GCN2-like isoform X2 [Nicrophorus vespilloides]|nr:PREDICTED: eIF-2-alpha kinase GCN2-like isoform X2 [Nicrophorus vespilloides]XP_017776445.1 PREDICTED: eIF-2-alpha kinase GCN2-like isoform X2 [Nicrophorus vespilloides]